MRKQRDKVKKKGEKATTNYFFATFSSLQNFQESNLEGNFYIWKDECVGGATGRP
jgi:hypothetical protein